MLPLEINGDHMKPEELSAVLAHAAQRAHDFAVLAVQEPDVVVRQIGNIQKSAAAGRVKSPHHRRILPSLGL